MTINLSVHTDTDDARFLELLERWTVGDFSRSDEQELRALTETDGFRREAWEGFARLPEENHHLRLQALRRYILERTAGSRRIPVSRWMAAAACLLLAAAIYFLPPLIRDKQVTAVQTAPAPGEQANPSAPMDAENAVPSEYKTEQPTAARRQPIIAPPATADEALVEERPADETPAPPTDALAEKARVRTADSATGVAGGPASYQQASPSIPAAGGPAANMPKTAAPEAEKTSPQSEEARARDLALEPDAQAKKKSADKPIPLNAEPVGGWEDFYRYLRRNARLTDAARNNNISGYVRLQFSVGSGGNPQNIQTLKSLGYGCDEEAIRLIIAFQWMAGDGKPVTVEIPFVR